MKGFIAPQRKVYPLAIISFGGIMASSVVMAATQENITNTSNKVVHIGQVSDYSKSLIKHSKRLKETDGKLTKKKIFKSANSLSVIGKREIKAVGPAAGAAQALSIAPGVAVRGYGGVSGTSRYEIAVRGVKVGWSSENGDVERNGIAVLFDGVPMNNLISSNGSWDSNEIPIMQLIDGINVIYGPGDPSSRWYDSIGGTINFIPLQPSVKPSAKTGMTFGSNGTLGYNFDIKTGMKDGWAAVLAGGYIKNNTFRTGTFNAPSQAFAYYGKLVKIFRGGNFSIGGYIDSAREFRPNTIPTEPIAGITTTGLNGNAPLYSQATSGFYYSLPESTWVKQNKVQDFLIYSHLNIALSRRIRFHELFWYRHGHRVHARIDNYIPGNTSNSEYYNPTSITYGDKIYFSWSLPVNHIKAGGSLVDQHYSSTYAVYNSLFGTSPSYPSGYTDPVFYNKYLTGFIQDTITPVPSLEITPGLAAVQYNTQFYNNGNEYFPNTPAGSQNVTTVPNSTDSISGLEPSVSVRISPNKWSALYANYAKSYQNPTDISFGAYNGNGGIVDLADLKPIGSTDYEVGAKFLVHKWGLLNNFTFNANYFYDRLSNETIPTYLTTTAVTKFASADATINGVNFSFSDNPDWNWHLFSSLSIQHSYFNSYITSSGSAISGVPVAYSPSIIMTAGINYRLYFKGFLLTPQLLDQFTGAQYMFNNSTGEPSHQKQPSYNVTNFMFGVKTSIFDQDIPTLSSVTINIGVDNLFGTKYNASQYISSGGYYGGNSAGAILAEPGAPRQYFINVETKF